MTNICAGCLIAECIVRWRQPEIRLHESAETGWLVGVWLRAVLGWCKPSQGMPLSCRLTSVRLIILLYILPLFVVFNIWLHWMCIHVYTWANSLRLYTVQQCICRSNQLHSYAYMCTVYTNFWDLSGVIHILHFVNSKIIKADIVNSTVTLWYSGSVTFMTFCSYFYVLSMPRKMLIDWVLKADDGDIQ